MSDDTKQPLEPLPTMERLIDAQRAVGERGCCAPTPTRRSLPMTCASRCATGSAPT
jgi:hypothetical protein